uniref:Uncharacterized protein n=1 Tax=Anguilla anguilla TaxID=7936 RepID=A0A0E9XN74_ANGAN
MFYTAYRKYCSGYQKTEYKLTM